MFVCLKGSGAVGWGDRNFPELLAPHLPPKHCPALSSGLEDKCVGLTSCSS